MNWFETLTGVREESPEQVRRGFRIEGNRLTSLANGQSWQFGNLETPSLEELRTRAASIASAGNLSLREVVADVQQLHCQPRNSGALFQVASQFNLLEMVSPENTPEMGIGIYERDFTQGPACAMAAGAGTIYRNYFVRVNDQTGQSANLQIDCVADLGRALGNTGHSLWKMKNGYLLPTKEGLQLISERLSKADEEERRQLRGYLRIGVQWSTEVTQTLQSPSEPQIVTQAYCSALPVAYASLRAQQWEPFARLILEAAYEATLAAAILNQNQTGNSSVYLTLLGGGAFGNEQSWISDAILRAVRMYRRNDLDIAIVSYGSPNPAVQRLLRDATD